MSGNCDVMAFFSIYGQFGAISNTTLILLLWGKVLFWPKNADFFAKNDDISKIKRALVLKVIFSGTKYVRVRTRQIWSF